MNETRFLDRPEGQLAYDVTGEGPLVIAMTGMGDVRSQYRFLRERLVADGYRVATLDLRGFGESSVGWSDYSHAALADDFIALAAELGGPATLVANSYSGGAALVASTIAPELVCSVVVLAPVIPHAPTTAFGRFVGRLMTSAPVRPIWGSYWSSLYPSVKPEGFEAHRAEVVANIAERGRWSVVGTMVKTDNSATIAALAAVTVPVLALFGGKDKDLPDAAAELSYLQASVNAEGTVLDGIGHYPHAEAAAVSLPLISEFVERSCRALA